MEALAAFRSRVRAGMLFSVLFISLITLWIYALIEGVAMTENENPWGTFVMGVGVGVLAIQLIACMIVMAKWIRRWVWLRQGKYDLAGYMIGLDEEIKMRVYTQTREGQDA